MAENTSEAHAENGHASATAEAAPAQPAAQPAQATADVSEPHRGYTLNFNYGYRPDPAYQPAETTRINVNPSQTRVEETRTVERDITGEPIMAGGSSHSSSSSSTFSLSTILWVVVGILLLYILWVNGWFNSYGPNRGTRTSFISDTRDTTNTMPDVGRTASAGPAASEQPDCSRIPGAVYSREAGGCVQHVTDVAQVRAVSPDMSSDPSCRGKPPGFRYDVPVTGPQGQRGIAHRVCGRRPL